MINLYAIDTVYRTLDAMLEESAGVLTPEIEAYMESINAYAVGKVFDLLSLKEEADKFADLCKREADEMSRKHKTLAARADFYKAVIVKAVSASGQKTLTNGVYKITLTTNPLKVEIVDETAIPSTYKSAEVKMSWADYDKIKDMISVQSVKVSPDKKEIGNLYKSAGVEVAGVKYIQEPNVRIS